MRAGVAGTDSKQLRVSRGGSYFNNSRNVRCAYRNWNNPDNRNDNIGFRVALSTFFLAQRRNCQAGLSESFQAEAKNGGIRSWPRPGVSRPGT